MGGINIYGYALGNPIGMIDLLGLQVKGVWVKKPLPQVYDVNIPWGEAYRPAGWWRFWENGFAYEAIRHAVDVQVGFTWKVRCSESDDCEPDSWEVSAGIAQWVRVYVPIYSPIHPSLGSYVTLWNMTKLLTEPASSEALKIANGWADTMLTSQTATEICKTWPRPVK